MRVIPVHPRDALDSLIACVREVKGDDPLRPVSVIVPTNATGVTARRYLGRHGGVGAVDMITLYRLAEVLGSRNLVSQHRRPVSTPVIDLAIRAVLADSPGAYATVADHPSTVVALREFHRELRLAGPQSISLLASASERGREAARVSSLTTERLRDGWYDEGDLLAQAIDHATSGEPLSALEHIVVFLPHPLRGLDLQFVRALSRSSDVTVLVAVVGDPAVDREITAMAAALGDCFDAGAEGSQPAADHRGRIELLSTTDADEEVRHAVRLIVDAARDGTPFGRIALLWPTDRPYARLVEHHLAAAEIPWNGRPGTGVAERIVPRFLLDLLDVDRRGLRRRDLFDLLADLPVRNRSGTHVPVARWERVSREAGVTRDEDWVPRLRAYAARERDRAARAGRDTSDRADDAESLVEYVDDLRSSLGHRSATERWDAWVRWSEQQIDRRLGPAMLATLSEPERVAFEHTNRVLDRLRSLDEVGGRVTRPDFRAMFASEFEVAPGRLGRIGHGITVGSLSGAVGLDVDLAIVLGAADGLMPPAPRPGPLVGDTERVHAGLAPSDTVAWRMHRQFRSVLAAADRSVIVRPRGDLRATTLRHATRWLDDITRAAQVSDSPSHHAAMLGTEFPAHSGEHRLRSLLAAAAEHGPISGETARVGHDPVLQRALVMRRARSSATITEFDGDLSALDVAHFARPMAPTQLEQWVACPHGYFVRFLLGVTPVEEPGDQMDLTPAERGNLIHRALDRFHREVIDESLPQPADGWSAEHWSRLREIFDEVADQFESSGRTGRVASWSVQRVEVLHDLANWFRFDSDQLAATGATIVSSEQSFGHDGAVTLPLAGGREVGVRGQIDRVDRTPGGGLIVVDHKTGGTSSYKDISPAEPTADGTRFQLAAYAAGAAHIVGGAAAVRAEYSFFGKGDYRRIGYELDEHVWRRVGDDLAHVVGGIESGLFPAKPDAPGYQHFVTCWYCTPDGLGTAERFPEWQHKRNDPRGASWFADPDAGDNNDHSNNGDDNVRGADG